MWKTLKSYIWWTHPRGSVHYDVMVTLILAFIFISPHYIDFHEKPAVVAAIPVRVISFTGPDGSLAYIIRSEDVSGTGDELRKSLQRTLFPVTGPASIDHYEPVLDENGNIAAYRVWMKH